MKNSLVLVISCLLVLTVTAQRTKKKEESFYMLDENFKGTQPEKAAFLIHAVKESDTCWQFDTYSIFGPMIRSEQYKDEKAQQLHGRSVYFNSKGSRDSMATFYNGVPDGLFYYFNDTGRTYLQKKFKQGLLTEKIDRLKQDSADSAASAQKKDTVMHVEMESGFTGGDQGWGKYLTKKLIYPERAQKLQKQGTVITQFIIDTEGHVFDQEIIQSVEFSLDQETVRIINESPAWKPAVQDGKKVKSYKKQPLTFRLQ